MYHAASKSALLGLVACSLFLCQISPAANAQQAQSVNKQPASAQSSGAQAGNAAASPMDQFPNIVAVVNGLTITRAKLGQDCLKRYGTVVLDNLLNKELILQACRAKNINITQADVNNEIERVASKVGLTTKLFLQALEDERDIKPEQYASEIVWPMLALRALAAEQIQVTPDEVDRVLQSEYGPKRQVRMIAVSQLEKAEELLAHATAAPETFRRLAKQHSEDATSASVEGLLPPIRRNSGDDQLEHIAFQLQPNEISPIFKIGELHIILQCVRHLEASFPSAQLLPMIQGRIADQLRDQRLGEAADGIFSTLQANSNVVAVIGNAEMEAKYPGVAGYINGRAIPMVNLAAACISRHGREILRGEISRLLLNESLKKTEKTITQEDIEAEVARAADMAGYINRDGTPDIEGWYKSIIEEDNATIELYISDAVWPSVALKKLVEDHVQITNEDLQKGYESNFGPRAEVLAIVLSNERTAHNVFREARDNLTEQSFGELAAKHSVEPVSRSNFGKIPPIRRHAGRPTLEDAAFKLLPGEISGILAWGEQYAILYKQGETKPLVKQFEVVRDELYREIREKKLRVAMHRKLDQLLKDSQIDNFLEGTAQTGKVVQASASGKPNSNSRQRVKR